MIQKIVSIRSGLDDTYYNGSALNVEPGELPHFRFRTNLRELLAIVRNHLLNALSISFGGSYIGVTLLHYRA